jgi:hypothetical protein
MTINEDPILRALDKCASFSYLFLIAHFNRAHGDFVYKDSDGPGLYELTVGPSWALKAHRILASPNTVSNLMQLF